MKKSVFNIFQKRKKNTADQASRTTTKKIVFNTASYSEFQYKQNKKGTPASRTAQQPDKREIARTSKISQKRLAIIGMVVFAAVAVPVFFAAAANNNEVAKMAEINLSSASPSPLQAGNASPSAAASGGELIGDLTESLTQAIPVSANAEPTVLPAISADPNALPTPSATASDVPASPSASPETAEVLTAEGAFLTFTQGQDDPFVSMIQQRLMDLDYMESDETTTLFGPTTSQAIEYFQRKNNLPVDGSAGPATLQVLFSNTALHYTVSQGADGPDVESIQDRLKDLGYNITVTGHFGTDTEKAVIAFQKRNNLTDDGNVGADTKEHLYSSKAKGPKSTGSSSGSTHTGNSTHIANPGSVEAFIQCAMNQLGVPYRLGGKSNSSLDCSGLVYYALKLSGNGIGYMTSGGWSGADQYARISSMSALQRGDIVCVRGHVGIYLGNGTVIHASSSRGSVCISNNIFNSSYWTNNWICGRRPL